MNEVKAYLANQFGFSETGRYILDNLIKSRIEEIGIIILDPFIECAKQQDLSHLDSLTSYKDKMKFWNDFNLKVTPTNNQLMLESRCLLAILDGGPAIDDGVSSEIGFYAGIKQGPIFALRSDFRCGENIATTINSQVLGYILQSGGKLIDGKDSLERWFSEIERWYESVK